MSNLEARGSGYPGVPLPPVLFLVAIGLAPSEQVSRYAANAAACA
jgi:hypothetical protein